MTRYEPSILLTPLYGPEFTAAPERTYERLRAAHGDCAPVELAPGIRATLVLSYRAALQVLRDPAGFRRDPRQWQHTVPPDSPVLGTIGYRPNAMFSDGDDHRRLRAAITDALGQVNHAPLRRDIVAVADGLIDRMAGEGRADLMTGYALPLLMMVFTRMFGCSDDMAERIMLGVQRLFDGSDPAEANRVLDATLQELLDHKRGAPGDDVVSRLLAGRARLSDDELKHTVLVLMGAGSEPAANLVGGALVELLTNADLSEGLAGGTVAVDAAIDEILWRRPPMSNYAVSYPVRPYPLYGNLLPAGEPVVVSFAAANADPAAAGHDAGDGRVGNRAHLAFSSGAHACPVPQMALLLAATAVERVLERLPGMTLACPVEQLPWRVSPFSRGLSALPVTFPPAPVTARRPVAAPAPQPDSWSPPAPRVRPGVLAALGRWWRGE